MGATAIRAASVAKRYQIGGGYGYKTIAETLTNVAGAAFRMPRARAAGSRRFVWALDDVSFEIEAGEVVGIVGANGAGKTTLLKILSRITRPTRGWTETHGRVGSLLEVGTGFHPELTGRENVFLSGAILGMRKRETSRRFDEIVEFADIGDFLETPIKRYSSGMKVRLAFAVAAHLEPEILIVDEVLAVGDVAFQKKCLGKMGAVTSEGRTVLFVSHNMALVRALCRRGILLSRGSVVTDSSIDDAIGTYLRSLEEIGRLSLLERTDRHGWQQVVLSSIEISGQNGHGLATGDPATFVFRVNSLMSRMSCTFTIYNQLGHAVTTLSSAPATREDDEHPGLEASFECAVDELLLVPGRYRIDVTIMGQSQLQDKIEGAAFFDVEEGPLRGRPLPEAGQGDVVLPHRWRGPA
jgi:lipopolysaccharide transport system ATP-binding protein